MSTKPFFSIIIPTLNEEKFLPKLLIALTRQKEHGISEIIVVDGNSDDKTRFIVQDFSTLAKLRCYRVKKKNVSYQRNFGALKAAGKYLIFLDADVGINPAFLKRLKMKLEKAPFLVGMPLIQSEEKSYETEAIFNAVNFIIEMSHKIGDKPFVGGGSLIFERNFFLHLGGFNEKVFIAEDHDIVRRAKAMGVSAQILENIAVKPSLRRFRKEGRLKLFIKYLIGTLHYLKDGVIYDEIFEYNMGGKHYKIAPKHSTHVSKNFTDQLVKITKIKAQLEKLLKKQFA